MQLKIKNLITFKEAREQYHIDTLLNCGYLPPCETHSDQWHTNRGVGLGGSDIGAVLGLNQYKGQLQVYFEKTQGITEDLSKNYAVRRGNALEHTLLEQLAIDRQDLIIVYDVPTLFDVEQPYRRVNVDALALSSDLAITVVECKTASFFAEMHWDGLIPDSYLAQVYWAMGIVGANSSIFAIDAGGIITYSVEEADQQAIKETFNACDNFWKNHVLNNNPPRPNFADLDHVKKHNKTYTEGIYLDSDDDSLVLEYQTLKQREKHIKIELKTLQAQLIDSIGDNTGIKTDGFIVNYKASKGFDEARFIEENPKIAMEYQTFNSKKFKEERKTLHAKYKTLTGSRSLRVTTKKGQ